MIEFTALGENHGFDESEDIQQPQRKLEISMTITKIGLPEKMEIVDPPEDITKKEIRTIFREIRKKRFRPRLVDGEATSSSLVYPYLDKLPELYREPENNKEPGAKFRNPLERENKKDNFRTRQQ